MGLVGVCFFDLGLFASASSQLVILVLAIVRVLTWNAPLDSLVNAVSTFFNAAVAAGRSLVWKNAPNPTASLGSICLSGLPLQ